MRKQRSMQKALQTAAWTATANNTSHKEHNCKSCCTLNRTYPCWKIASAPTQDNADHVLYISSTVNHKRALNIMSLTVPMLRKATSVHLVATPDVSMHAHIHNVCSGKGPGLHQKCEVLRNKREKKTTPFVNLTRSLVIYQAAQM